MVPSAKHLPLGLPAQVKISGMYMKGQGLVRCVHVPGRHRTDGSQPGDKNSLKPMWPVALQSASVNTVEPSLAGSTQGAAVSM